MFVVVVSIGIHRKYNSELITIPYDSVEQVYVSIKSTRNNKKKLIIGSCYIPEVSPLSTYETHVDTVNWLFEGFGDNLNLILSGDYNFRGTTFSYDNTGLVANGRMSETVNTVFDVFSTYNLSQYNSLRNPFGNTLDLVFSNLELLSVDLCTNPLVPIDIPHPPLLINCVINVSKISSCSQLIRKNFKKTDLVSISMALNKVNWNELFSGEDIDSIVEEFYNIVNTILDKYVPTYIESKKKFPQWFNNNLRNLVKEKRIAHKNYKINPSPSTYSNFSELNVNIFQINAIHAI